MTAIPLISNDKWFYPLLFAVWMLVMFMLHGNYSYFQRPLSSDFTGGQLDALVRQEAVIESSIEELRDALETEEDLSEHGHIYHNIGVAYYDYYKVQRTSAYLDSARTYFEESIQRIDTVARFYYNLGRLYMEQRDMDRARELYEQAIRVDGQHILALHNLGLLYYFELKQPLKARDYLHDVLEINRGLPITNYVLGEIALERKKFETARVRFEQEVANFSASNPTMSNLPASSSGIHYAVSQSYLNLALLHSSEFVDQKRAQNYLHAYLSMERDPARKKEAVNKMQKFWKMN